MKRAYGVVLAFAVTAAACGPGGGGTDAGRDSSTTTGRDATAIMPTRCTAPNMMCGTGATQVCVNVQTSNAHCGMCGRACTAGQTCRAGTCTAPTTDAGTCAAPNMTCSGRCTSVQTDPANCGRCGNRCATGQLCRAGACAAAPTADAAADATTSDAARADGGAVDICGDPFLVACGAGTANLRCVDPLFDDANCGSCGNRCGNNQTCFVGTCACILGTECGSACVDVNSDSANCGACGTTCMSDEICSDGACQVVSCRAANGVCTSANDCCGLMGCEEGKCACVRGGQPCVSSFDCCGPGLCNDGVCSDNSYLSVGSTCQNSLQCDGALLCISGTCQ